MSKPLEGVVVLDLTRVLAGPYCTMMLSDLGARVIKVERPGVGDDSRQFGPFKNDLSAYYVGLNRGKESIAVDLKSEEGKNLIRDFVKKADVLVENFRPGTMEKLGLSYDLLKRINPRLIYAASSGFGHTGPWSYKPCYDMIVQALGGIMSITGYPGQPPVRVGASIGDIIAGVFTTVGINAALYQRSITGLGRKVDVAMLDCQVAILENALIRYAVNGINPEPMGTRHPTIAPFQSFQTKDDYMILAVGNDNMWLKFCAAAERNDLAEDERFLDIKGREEHFDELIGDLVAMFKTKTTDEWINILDGSGVPCCRINKIDQVLKNPQLHARNMFIKTEYPGIGELTLAGNPVKFEGMAEPGTRPPAPTLGRDTEKVLSEVLKYNPEKIEKLIKLKVVATS